MSFTFAPPTARRRPSLTPMIDVVFLLLIFFMLASRFGMEDQVTLSAALPGAAEWSGPPRLVDIGAAELRLNGQDVPLSALPEALVALTDNPDDPILLRPQGADTQALLDVMSALRAAGFTRLLLVAP